MYCVSLAAETETSLISDRVAPSPGGAFRPAAAAAATAAAAAANRSGRSMGGRSSRSRSSRAAAWTAPGISPAAAGPTAV